MDNNEDGKVDYPQDLECAGPGDDDEAGVACLPLLTGRNVAVFSQGFERAMGERVPRLLPLRTEAAAVTATAVAQYFACVIQEEPEDFEFEPVCVEFEERIDGGRPAVEPDPTGKPVRCPALDCRIDEPGCWDPYPYRRAAIPADALRAVALWSQNQITPKELDQALLALAKAGKLRVDAARPQRRRYLPQLRPAAGIGIAVGLLVVGLVLGRLVRGRGSPRTEATRRLSVMKTRPKLLSPRSCRGRGCLRRPPPDAAVVRTTHTGQSDDVAIRRRPSLSRPNRRRVPQYRGSRGKQSFARFRTRLISSTSESGSSFPCASHGLPSPRSVAMIR